LFLSAGETFTWISPPTGDKLLRAQQGPHEDKLAGSAQRKLTDWETIQPEESAFSYRTSSEL
jgi:hypothetical protein